MKQETVQGIVEEWQDATIEALVGSSAPSHRTKMVWVAGLSLIERPPAAPELHPAERVFEVLRRAVQREVHGTIEDTMAAVDRELTNVIGSHLRIRRLAGCAWMGDTFNQLPQQCTALL